MTRAPRRAGSAPGSTQCFELPWGVESEDRLDIAEASRILDADHDGLTDVKERILEHLAVRKLQAERGLAPVDGRGSGAILALVGPPGVGKTSLGESVAHAMGASSSGCPWVACVTRPRSVVTVVPTSGPSRDGWCVPCVRPGR